MATRRPVDARPRRPDLLHDLKHGDTLAPLVATLPEDLRFEWEERAAIDGGMSRADAERCAYRDVIAREV